MCNGGNDSAQCGAREIQQIGKGHGENRRGQQQEAWRKAPEEHQDHAEQRIFGEHVVVPDQQAMHHADGQQDRHATPEQVADVRAALPGPGELDRKADPEQKAEKTVEAELDQRILGELKYRLETGRRVHRSVGFVQVRPENAEHGKSAKNVEKQYPVFRADRVEFPLYGASILRGYFLGAAHLLKE